MAKLITKTGDVAVSHDVELNWLVENAKLLSTVAIGPQHCFKNPVKGSECRVTAFMPTDTGTLVFQHDFEKTSEARAFLLQEPLYGLPLLDLMKM